MAASYRNTDWFPPTGYEYAADTPRLYHSHTDVPSFEKVSPGMINEMFYHGNGVPSDFQRSSNSTRNQSSLQHYGDLYGDDSRHFVPFDSLNQQYPVPEHIHVPPEFHMFQANSRHFDRHANERHSSETDYMMRSRGNFGLRNNIFGEPRGLNLNPFSGEKMLLPMASTRTCMKHLGSSELSANGFDMGPPHGVFHDAFETASSSSYGEQAYTQCKSGPFSASSSSPTWEIDYNFPPLDEARSGSYNDFCQYPAMLDMLTERNRGLRTSMLNGKSNTTYGLVDHFCQQDLLSQFRDAKFFVIKSYSEDNVHKSIKYCVWASTKNGNKKLDAAYREAKKKEVACPVFLLFSEIASAQFCGVAEMVGPVDFNTSVEYWQQDRWSGHFPVKWLIVKDVPNSLFRHIIIENNDNKPVTNSRDTQEPHLVELIMSLIRRVILGRRFCTAVPRRAEDIMSNPDCRATVLEERCWYLIASRSDLDTAAKYARLAVFSRTKTEDTELTCSYIIGGMLRDKRHKDAYDLYDYFFNQHKLKPTYHCCNYIIESRFQQGLVDEALDFHRSIKSGMALGYPSHHTFRILTKGLVHSGQLDQAEALLKAKEVGSIIYPDHVAFNNLIRGHLDLGNIDKANLVLNEFKRLWSGIALSKHSPDDSICSEYENRVAFLMATFMEYWFKQGKEMEAMECYDRSVLANKFPVSGETGNALLKILLKYGKKTHAWALYHEMLDQSCYYILNSLNSVTVEIMVDECFDMGRCSEAIETYNKAVAKNNVLSDAYIITRCCENGMLSEAESLFAASRGLGFGFIDNTIFRTMIDAYLKAGRIDDAIKTSNKMINATLKDVSHLF